MLWINCLPYSKCLLPCLLWFYLCYKQTMEPFSIGSGILPCYSVKAGMKKFIHCHVFCPCLWSFLLVYKGWLKYLLTYYLILCFPKEHSILFFTSGMDQWGSLPVSSAEATFPIWISHWSLQWDFGRRVRHMFSCSHFSHKSHRS